MMIVYGAEKAAEVLRDRRKSQQDDLPHGVLETSSQALGQPVASVDEFVRLVLARVRDGGDRAVRDLTERLDGRAPGDLEVPRSSISDAYEQVSDDVVEALRLAADRAREFHRRSLPTGWFDEEKGYGEVFNAVGRAGAYVPAGSAPLPSTAIMTIVPARVAGVPEVIAVTPPGPGGSPDPSVLVAADIAGVDRVFGIGGAQAIAAMAYGTETVPAVDMLCGPGNVFVTAAKKMLFGEVGVDGLYGPTETLVVADAHGQSDALRGRSPGPGGARRDGDAYTHHDLGGPRGRRTARAGGQGGAPRTGSYCPAGGRRTRLHRGGGQPGGGHCDRQRLRARARLADGRGRPRACGQH